MHDDPAVRRYHDEVDGPEVELPRGDVTEGVVRVGGTVRRPFQPQSLAVAGYLDHLERAGFPASPRYLGRDNKGRDVLTYLEGDVPGDPPQRWAADDGLLASVARLVRRLHEASWGYAADRHFAAPAGSAWGRDLVRVEVPIEDPTPELVSHGDVTPQNVAVRGGVAVGLLDFDLAGPTGRLLDVYNTAMHWVPLRPPEDIWPAWRGLVDQAARLRLFADAYGLSAGQRAALPELGIVRAEVSWLRMKAAAEQLGGGWARMWADGVGDAIRRRQAWLTARRGDFAVVLR
ncbi:phosphotransferase [Krasilnikovia sp. MM14-A1259]|uniref:phosphotransferase n=1 Tax=Krasilnikovia sp. MM14-A1259 TaxID=3373539 RepID=UPI00399CED23